MVQGELQMKIISTGKVKLEMEIKVIPKSDLMEMVTPLLNKYRMA